MNKNNIQIQDEVSIKKIIRIIYRYKYMIIFLLILFASVSSYIAYFKPDIYEASSTVEVGTIQGSPYGRGEILAQTGEASSGNIMTEMEIIKSRFIFQKVLKEVNFSHKYYTIRKFKEIELYKASPFEVGMNKGYGISFDFYPLDDKKYRLVVTEAKDKNGAVWNYDEINIYGKEIVTKHFHLNILKTKEAKDTQYRFVIIDPAGMTNFGLGNVSVKQLSEYSNILQISYTDNVALRAKETADALARAYITQSVDKKTKEATRKLAFIDKQLKVITENLKGSAVKLEEFKRSSNTVDLSAKAENIIRHMSNEEAKLAEITIQEEMLNSLTKQVRSGRNLESISISGGEMFTASISPMIVKLQETIMKKKVLRESYTELHPEVRKLRKTIIQLKKVLVSTVKNLDKSMKERKALLEKSIEKEQKLLNKLPADERMFGQLQRKFVVNEKVYSYLLEKRLETEIVRASTVSQNRIVDEALTPRVSVKPERKKIVFIGLGLGLILGILLALLRNFLDDRIKEEEDVSSVTDIPIVGLIPNIKQDNDKLKVFRSPKSAVAEAFRNLRTNLQFMSNYKSTHTIVITSTVGGEGKTTVSTNLAGIMSMAGKKTVILNLDMRKPTLHERFGLPNKQGMSTLLSGSTSLGKVIQETEYENLDVITSGPVPPNPSELIQSELMEKVMEKLKEVYDVIILDTPPVGLVVDAKTLMHLVDTSIYVMRANYSKKSFLKSIKEISSLQEIRGLSILLNDVKQGEGGYGYGNGYGYYEEEKK